MKQESVLIFYDSSSTLYLCKNLAQYERTEHINIKLHLIRNEVLKRIIKMVKIHIDENPTNILTKVVPMAMFKKCLNLAGVYSR